VLSALRELMLPILAAPYWTRRCSIYGCALFTKYRRMNMTVQTAEMQRVFSAQRATRLSLKRSSAADRCARLLRLREAIVARTDSIDAALHADLRKMKLGAKNSEISSVLHDIDETVAHLESWMTDEIIEPSPQFVGNQTRIQYEPRGTVLLLGPWNFPFALIFAPLVPIIAAGNTCIVKPNELQPETSAIVAAIIRETFLENEVAVFEGGIPVAEALQNLPFDHVFFTGSPAIGKRVMAAAARHLSSVTLELGGKCPAIVGAGYDLADAAGKIAGARFTNAGQLCLSVDHVWVPRSERDALLPMLSAMIERMFYKDGDLQKARLSRMVDARNFDRVRTYVDEAVAQGAKIVAGGTMEPDDLTIHPTLLIDVPLSARIMQEEIFGPVLPVLCYDSVDEIEAQVDATGKPLAIYVFSYDESFIADVLERTSSGGVTVNNVIMHYLESKLPFGGVNSSGIGRYKGIHGFRELSHARSVFVQSA
jgi:aldehyde dehydrogenase (NAD+)